MLAPRARNTALDEKTLCLQRFFACCDLVTFLRSLFVAHTSRVHKMQQSAFTELCWPTARTTRSLSTRSALTTQFDWSLTITAGPTKGDVVAVRSANATLDLANLLGIPARIVVTDGAPRVQLEP